MSALATPRLTVKEYLELDRAAELKSEYHDGEVFPIAAVSFRHGRLAVRAGRILDTQLSKNSCEIASSPVRVRVSATQYVYPDLVVVCGKPQFTDEHVDTITNPKVIVEVLSPSTADYDQGGKFELYQQLGTFEEYMLVSQDQVKVKVFRKQSSTMWTMETFTGAEAIIRLDSLPVEFPLSELYEGILEA